MTDQTYWQQAKEDFFTAFFTHIKTTEDLDGFFHDLLTPKEYKDVIERFALCRELDKGLTVREISEKLEVAPARVVRGNRLLKYDGKIIKKLISPPKS